MTMEIVITIPLCSERDAESAIAALQSEVEFKGRASAAVSRDGKKVTIRIAAEDISSLHATAGSFMRALKVILAV